MTNSSLEKAYRQFVKIYRGRDDCTAVKKAGAYSQVPGGLTETPFYPRSVEAGTTGDRIQLPFRMNTNTGRKANLISDLVSFDPKNYDPEPDFSPLERVRPVDADLILNNECITM